ncbi:tyrosine-protein phosphatase non-receptor type 4-like isoform X2 [Antedon mediterranea]|uniref:tyrosine-protein phosphatase non-receptor type 4-like isoform X2 n=1 Tax=Antedon mediterranea TaxID=105859 RepID=UPI003AF54D16
MSRRFRTSSGSYNVRANEIAREQQERKMRCIIAFLDDTEHTFEIERRAKGQCLLEEVFRYLDLIECDYFGLKFIDSDNTLDNKRWLDPTKSVRKQVKGPMYFYFRVKFFVSDPSKLQEEYTRYQFVLQLRKDLLEGRLICSFNIGTLLASFIVQAELGDYDPLEHPAGYVSAFRFIPGQGQTETFNKEVERLHKTHYGQSPADSEYNFLNKVKNLELYGVDLHYAKDHSGIEIQLGITSSGIIVFQNSSKINTFSWAKIVKISFKRKQFFIQLRREMGETRDSLIGFNLGSYRSCKNLWKSCVEHHTFFRLAEPQPSQKKRVMFQLGSKYRYREVSGEPMFEQGVLPLGPKYRYSGRTELQTMEDAKKRLANKDREFHRSPSKKVVRRTIGGTTTEVIRAESRTLPAYIPSNRPEVENQRNSRFFSFDGKIPSSPHEKSKINGFSKKHRLSGSSPDILFIDDGSPPSNVNGKSYDLTTGNYGLTNGVTSANLVTIRMVPDKQGRFGFNVKGGSDQNTPVIVSRVAPNTPADLCIPRLNEGDQILFLNDLDVSKVSHEKVVATIRSMGIAMSKELVLTVRPNVYVGAEEEEEEPLFQYIPESPRVANLPDLDALAESIMLLREGLESGTALVQFEQLYRKKPGMTMNICRHPDNICKNRYRDIAPYDVTRILLKEIESGDYINANAINMEISKAGLINRYIAAQGPLPNTCGDFWYMVWEQNCSLIVMLTANVERGRVKCHKYWPELGHHLTYPPHLEVTCTQCDESSSFANRDFVITNTKTNETRNVVQMQYIAWPDHGVPDDSSDFLDFVLRVRQHRVGMEAPTVVHCSAGIGRTGVLITMETAMCLIESNEPVYPLDIVKTMRDQRAMLIQTTAQYRFVCDAIVRVYLDEIIRPGSRSVSSSS